MTDETDPEAGTGVAEQPPEAADDTGKKEDEKPKKLTQTVEMRDIGPCKKHIKVTIDRTDIDKRLNDKYSDLRIEANVPGFRPGKTPRKIIEKRFAKDVGNEVKGEIMYQSLEQLAEEHDVAPLSAPNLDPAKIEIPADGPMIYEFEVEVRPHFDLPEYKGLKLKRPVRTFTDEDVIEEEGRLLARYGELIPKPEGNAQVGDYLVADLTTRDGDRLVSELKDLKIRIENRLAFKDAVAEKFGTQVQGANAGDAREVDLTFSASASDSVLHGKTLKSTVKVNEVKMMKLPELTPEFLAGFGVRTREQLRERVRVLLNRRLEYSQRQSAREQFLAQITTASSWELPQDLLARQARKALNRRVMEMRSSGMAEEEIRGRLRVLQQDTLQSTALALKEHFVLQKIAETEKIDVDDDDLHDEIDRMADQYGESPRRLRARLEKEDMLEALAIEIVERKALDLILDSAEYEDVPLGRQEGEVIGTVEEQASPGEMKDPADVPAEEPPTPTSPEASAPSGEKSSEET